jgi:hypothetical protein
MAPDGGFLSDPNIDVIAEKVRSADAGSACHVCKSYGTRAPRSKVAVAALGCQQRIIVQ